jgi:hypothetical protein
MEDGGRLAPMAAKLVDRLAILVDVRRFPCMGAADSRSLRSESYVSMQHLFADLLLFRFGVFWGMCDVNSCNVCCSSWHSGFLSPQHFSGGQC